MDTGIECETSSASGWNADAWLLGKRSVKSIARLPRQLEREEAEIAADFDACPQLLGKNLKETIGFEKTTTFPI